jgi:hypothetical protein
MTTTELPRPWTPAPAGRDASRVPSHGRGADERNAMTDTRKSPAVELAEAVDGTLRAASLIIIPVSDGVHVIDCTATGRVLLRTPSGGPYQLGSLADGTDHLAAMYRAATAEVCS